MSIYTEFTAVPVGCVICYNPLAAPIRIFPCGCRLPLHDACVPFWKTRSGTCPLCQTTWTPLKAMSHPLVAPPLFSTLCTVRSCTIAVLLLVFAIIALILYYFIALR